MMLFGAAPHLHQMVPNSTDANLQPCFIDCPIYGLSVSTGALSTQFDMPRTLGAISGSGTLTQKSCGLLC